MNSPQTTVTVQVPGSTSNLGPGFDCMGAALSIYNRVSLRKERTTQSHPMIEEAAAAYFQESQQTPFPFSFGVEGNVPLSRGLGSSVTVRLGVLAGLNRLCGDFLDRRRVFELCWQLEGHPDNAAASAFGGFCLTNECGSTFQCPIPESLTFVLLVPDREQGTDFSRSTLPEDLPRLEAVRGLGNACVLTAALASGRHHLLKGAFDDTFHQPYRVAQNPGLKEVIAAAESTGAYGGFLSGSGSAIAAVCESDIQEAVGQAMREAWPGPDLTQCLCLVADNKGYTVL